MILPKKQLSVSESFFGFGAFLLQQLSKPIFELTDEEIANIGKVFAAAKTTMCLSRDNFSKVFAELADRVIKLTE